MGATDNVDSAFQQLEAINKPIERYLFLRRFLEENPTEFWGLLMQHTEDVLPYIYTPTVGEACQRYHALPGMKVHGLYITLNDKGKILDKLRAWHQQPVRVVVVTDGERILGLGDLGAGGMGISEGKITLYTVAAGVDPSLCLPVCLDVGTNNKELLNDPGYKGLRRERAKGEEYDSFVAEFMDALRQWQPHVLLQFEDFGNHNAFRLLERYRGSACCFNDDIQGTAAITLAALLAAVHAAGTPLGDQRILFFGAGEAGTGIGELIAYCLHRRTGKSLEESRRQCFFMDSKGLVVASRKADLQHNKLPFAHDLPPCKTLIEAVRTLKPTALIGVSTIPHSFTPEVLRAMAEINTRPIIFPLSNPTTKSECTFEEAVMHTDGRVLFASGSPFDPVLAFTHEGGAGAATVSTVKRLIKPAQANNAYVFPAVGLAAITTRASRIDDECFLVAAEALADLADPARVRAEGQLFPPFCDILQVSTHVAAVLARHMCETGLGIRPEGPVRGPTPQGAQSPNGNGVAADTLSPRRDQQKSPSPQPQEGARKANGSGPDVNKGSQDPELSAWREVVYANMWQGARPHAQRMPRSPSLVQAMQVCKL